MHEIIILNDGINVCKSMQSSYTSYVFGAGHTGFWIEVQLRLRVTVRPRTGISHSE